MSRTYQFPPQEPALAPSLPRMARNAALPQAVGSTGPALPRSPKAQARGLSASPTLPDGPAPTG